METEYARIMQEIDHYKRVIRGAQNDRGRAETEYRTIINEIESIDSHS